MQKLELFDETLDLDRTESYELSIQFTLNGFSFCIKDTVRNCFIALASSPFKSAVIDDSWHEPVSAITQQYNWVTNRFKRVIFCFESPVFTMVPQEFFEAQMSKKLLEQVHTLPDLYEVRHNAIHDGITSIFALPSALVNSWLKIQPKTHFVGFQEPVFAFHRDQKHSHKAILYTIAKADGFTAVFLSKGDALQLCTTIDQRSVMDTAYHLVNICKSLNIEPADVSVKALGGFSDQEQLEMVIGRFFHDFSYTHALDQNHFSYLLGKQKVKFANLFNLSLCEL